MAQGRPLEQAPHQLQVASRSRYHAWVKPYHGVGATVCRKQDSRGRPLAVMTSWACWLLCVLVA